MNFSRIVAVIFITIGLSACGPTVFTSTQSLLDPTNISTPLPDRAYWFGQSMFERGQEMTLDSSNTYKTPMSDEGQLSVQFSAFRDGYYIAQLAFSKDTETGFLNMIVFINDGNITLTEFDAKQVAESAGANFELIGDDKTGVSINSREDLLKITEYYVNNVEHKQASETLIVFDADEISLEAAAREYGAIVDAKESERKQEADQNAEEEKQRKEQEAARLEEERKRPKVVGDWAYTAELDPFTDKQIPRIIGRAAQFDGSPSAPVILFECKANELRTEMHWGVALDSFMEDNQDVHMAVLARFDNEDALRLIMVPSRDRSVTYEMNDFAKAGFGLALGIMKSFRSDLGDVSYGWTATDLFSLMSRSSKLALRSPTVHGVNATAIYDLSGFKEVRELFPASCR